MLLSICQNRGLCLILKGVNILNIALPWAFYINLERENEFKLYTTRLFGTAHNNFMSCFFLSNTYFQNSFMGEPSSHKDISWDKVEKSSLL